MCKNWIILTFSFFGFESYGNKGHWPFLTIDPMLQPKFEINLCGIDEEGLVFKLLHELRFDGEKYESHIFISGLNTFLVESGFNEMKLKTISGNDIIFNYADGMAEFDKNTWYIYRNQNSNTLFLAEDFNELYQYSGSFLKNSIINNSIYKFKYNNSSIGSILKVTDRGAKYIVRRIDYNELRYRLDIGKCTYIIEKNHYNKVTSLRLESSDDLILKLKYDNDLLSEVNHNGIKTNYNWMIAEFTEYVKPPLPIPPVVSNDGEFKYKAVWKHFKFIVSYESLMDKRKGSWVVDSREDEIKLTGKENDLRYPRNLNDSSQEQGINNRR